MSKERSRSGEVGLKDKICDEAISESPLLCSGREDVPPQT